MFDPGPHIDWMLGDGRHMELEAFIPALAERLVADDVPLMRVRLGRRTTHPLIAALSVFWDPEIGPLENYAAPHGLETRAAYIGSPMAAIGRTREPFRRRMGALGPDDHSSLHELQSRGATDYYGLPLRAVLGTGGLIIFVCNHPDGFRNDHIAGFDRIASALAPIIEARNNHQLATAIATSYLGPRTGRRVLEGAITRGNIETIDAAILFSDIRGWTALNATRPASEALETANRYFEVLSDAVGNNGGEILKFMGDGVLAVFPADGTEAGAVTACRQAVAAAHAAQGIAALSDLSVPFGIGIHYGDVLYGNVGARERLDFTILGQAVNIASRVEAFCGRLAQPVLVSDTVARIASIEMNHVATEPLKGLDTPMALHAPTSA